VYIHPHAGQRSTDGKWVLLRFKKQVSSRRWLFADLYRVVMFLQSCTEYSPYNRNFPNREGFKPDQGQITVSL
jgi:hypothetical protein